MNFNINHEVLVKLTPEGLSILERDHNALFSEPGAAKFKPPAVDENGYSKFQLWDLMSRFGSHCYNGCKLPFETNIILIEQD